MSLRARRAKQSLRLPQRLLRHYVPRDDTPRLAVFCSGYGSNFEAVVRAVRKGGIKAHVALVVCDNPKAYALKRAAKHKIPVFLASPKSFKTRADYERILVRVLRIQKTDLIVLAGFMRVLSPYFVRAWRGRILNIHPSLLPRFKGAHAIRDAFEAGERETGVSVHLVTEEVDAGPILAQKKVRIQKSDTFESLEVKIHQAEHKIYPVAIQKYIMSLQ